MRYAADSAESRFLAGDPGAHALVVRWVAQVLALPRFRLMRPEWRDLHQETLRRLVESLRHDRFDAEKDFRVYVQAIARYTAREALARSLRTRHSELLEAVDLEAAPRTDTLRLEAGQIKKVLEGLPEGCRGLFRQIYFDELSQVEVADRLGVPVGTVKSRLFRCLQRARELLLGDAQD